MVAAMPRVSWWLLGPICLGAGVLLGRLLPPAPASWREPPAVEPALPRQVAVPSLAPVVEQVAPSVVAVRSILAPQAVGDDVPGQLRLEATGGVINGTGFVVHHTGLLVTARHVVLNAADVTVWGLGPTPLRADLVGEDELTDIAVLRLQDPPPDLRPLPLGDAHEVRAGDWIVTIGNPFGFQKTVTTGVVSHVGRSIPHSDLRVTNNLLQFSAPVNPGSSGSPVLDLMGRVVGVTTQAMPSAQGISFAIPADTLAFVLDEMQHNPDGRVHRGYLGITFMSRRGKAEDGGPAGGAVIDAVADGAPAQRAGLLRDDVVLAVDDHRIADANDLYDCITHRAPGGHLRLSIQRAGAVLPPIDVVVGEVGQDTTH